MNNLTFLLPVKNEYENLLLNYQTYKTIVSRGHQLIIIDDMSTDNTTSFLAEKFNFCTLITLTQDTLKDNIIGKNNALIKGYKYCTNDILCFIDADVFNIDILEIEKLASSIDNTIVYTTIPKFINKGLIENFSLFFEQILWSNFHILKTKTEIFGGFYIITRDLYEEIGTHKSIKNKIVEDLELGKKISKVANIKTVKLPTLKIRMYRNFSDLFNGWSKNISYSFTNINIFNAIVLFTYIITIIFLLTTINFSIAYILITIIFLLVKQNFLETNSFYLLLWPLYLLFFIFTFFYSLFNKKKKWKGRTY